MPGIFTNPFTCHRQVVFKVNYSDLERYIQKVTGKRIEIPAILECENDTVHEVEVGRIPEWFDKGDQKKTEDFLFGSAKYPVKNFKLANLNWIMETMFIHNLLEKGTYIISVSW